MLICQYLAGTVSVHLLQVITSVFWSLHYLQPDSLPFEGMATDAKERQSAMVEMWICINQQSFPNL